MSSSTYNDAENTNTIKPRTATVAIIIHLVTMGLLTAASLLLVLGLARAEFRVTERGKKFSAEAEQQFRLYLGDEAGPVSAWHDVPLHTGHPGIVNMVVEIPR